MASTEEQHFAAPVSVPELHGDSIRLRMWDADSDADVEAWLRGLTDPEFQRWNTPLRQVTDADSARESLRSKVQGTVEGTSVAYCIADAKSGTPLGSMGLHAVEPVMRVARVGYWVLPEARGRRVAVRALNLASRWALTQLGMHRLELGHALGHEASCRVAELCGYRLEGTLRDAMFEAGRLDAFRDVHLHGRLATDPEPA